MRGKKKSTTETVLGWLGVSPAMARHPKETATPGELDPLLVAWTTDGANTFYLANCQGRLQRFYSEKSRTVAAVKTDTNFQYMYFCYVSKLIAFVTESTIRGLNINLEQSMQKMFGSARSWEELEKLIGLNPGTYKFFGQQLRGLFIMFNPELDADKRKRDLNAEKISSHQRFTEKATSVAQQLTQLVKDFTVRLQTASTTEAKTGVQLTFVTDVNRMLLKTMMDPSQLLSEHAVARARMTK